MRTDDPSSDNRHKGGGVRAVALSESRPFPMHSGIDIDRYFRLHLIGAAFPLAAGLLLFGWRALLVVGAVTGSTAVATYFWKRIGSRGDNLRYSHCLWMAILLSLTLPAHLASSAPLLDFPTPNWAILIGAGFVLVAAIWVMGGMGWSVVHPVLATHLVLVAAFGPLLLPHTVLHHSRLLVGDVVDVRPTSVPTYGETPWASQPPGQHDAVWYPQPAGFQLIWFTRLATPERSWVSLEGLIRDRLPPLEDLIFGGHPSPIGSASAVAVIVGGLMLLYRGVIDIRIPLVIVLVMIAALLILPVPVVITDTGRQWRWLVLREPGVALPVALTFANYQLFASPMLLMSFFLATSPAVRPLARRARVLYAALIGLLCAILQLYVDVGTGPYLALLLVGLLTPVFDHGFRPRVLVQAPAQR